MRLFLIATTMIVTTTLSVLLLGQQPASAAPAGTEPRDAAGAEPGGTEPADAEPASIERTGTEPVDTEPRDAAAAVAESRDAAAAGTESRDAAAVGTEPARAEPAGTEGAGTAAAGGGTAAQELGAPSVPAAAQGDPDASSTVDFEFARDPRRVRLPETVVEGARPFTAASSLSVRNRDFMMRPIRRPADILEVAPGLIVIQHAGGGKANQYLLRGFDADHGTDIAIDYDGIPINNVSHAHGQGFADINFVIPETIERVEVDKGPYFVEYGDFATAGAVNLVPRRLPYENSATFQAGRFNIYRGLAMGGGAIPGLEGVEGMIAVEGYGQDGPFENPEDMARYSLFSRLAHDAGPWSSDLTFTSYRASWNASGQIPLRAVREGVIDRFGSIDPTEGGTSQRHMLYARTFWRPDAETEARGLVYGMYYDLDLFSNFTFFLRDPVNGDQIEQKDKRWRGGAEAALMRRYQPGGFDLETTGGLGVRGDDILGNQLNYTKQRGFLSKQTDHGIGVVDTYAYGLADVTWTPWLRTLVGLRFDDIWIDVGNRLEDVAPLDLRGEGTDNDYMFSPKASVVLSPWADSDSALAPTQFFLNYGEGFHSNDARGVVRDVQPVDLITKARGGEIGMRSRFLDRLDLAMSVWLLDLDSEIVFVGDEGTTEPSGATRRIGGELEVRFRILDWLFFDVDYTETRGRFRFEPDDADDIPLAPRWTVSGGLAARREDRWFGSLRCRAISARPANEDGSLTAAGYTVWDLQLGKVWEIPPGWLGGRVTAVRTQIDITNLFDVDYREAQFATTSRLPFETEPVDDIGFTPGYPLTVIGGISVAF